MNKYATIVHMIRKNISWRLPVIITKQGKRLVAYSPALDLSTSGTSRKNVQDKFQEIVTIFFEEIAEMGTIDDVLSELGWKKINKQWNPPQVISSDFLGIRIPALS